mmetsp:Transcript_92472/g.283103  ORF Transcript_92472/g.283103 Transcript_92472/m.283103 type:complete len:376 (-) Transcript_92472:268-1395(-)
MNNIALLTTPTSKAISNVMLQIKYAGSECVRSCVAVTLLASCLITGIASWTCGRLCCSLWSMALIKCSRVRTPRNLPSCEITTAVWVPALVNIGWNLVSGMDSRTRNGERSMMRSTMIVRPASSSRCRLLASSLATARPGMPRGLRAGLLDEDGALGWIDIMSLCSEWPVQNRARVEDLRVEDSSEATERVLPLVCTDHLCARSSGTLLVTASGESSKDAAKADARQSRLTRPSHTSPLRTGKTWTPSMSRAALTAFALALTPSLAFSGVGMLLHKSAAAKLDVSISWTISASKYGTPFFMISSSSYAWVFNIAATQWETMAPIIMGTTMDRSLLASRSSTTVAIVMRVKPPSMAALPVMAYTPGCATTSKLKRV